MNDIKDKFSALLTELGQNGHIKVTTSKMLPGHAPADLKEIEEGLDITFHAALRDFYTQVGGLSLVWSLNVESAKAVLPDEQDLESIGGAIQILPPFDMIMGKDGMKWKNVLWFDHMDEQKKQEYQAFLPFDFPTPELVAGFQAKEKTVSDKMLLHDSSEGLRSFDLGLEAYLKELLRTKGYHYWQEFHADAGSEERLRFDRIMPILFNNK